MIFRKKKRMIDVRELQRRGVVRIPKQDIFIPTDSKGFVELGSNSKSVISTPQKESSNSTFFNFMGDSPSTSSTTETFSTESDGYNKREVAPDTKEYAERRDTKITELDNKIYKLEQRTELLEKKLNVNQPSNSSIGAMGW